MIARLREFLRRPIMKRQFILLFVPFAIFFISMAIKIAFMQHDARQRIEHMNASLDEINASLSRMLDGGRE